MVNQYFCIYFCQYFNRQLPFLNQRKGENDGRKDFMISLQESFVAELGFELETPGSAVRCATHCAVARQQTSLLIASSVYQDQMLADNLCKQFGPRSGPETV